MRPISYFRGVELTIRLIGTGLTSRAAICYATAKAGRDDRAKPQLGAFLALTPVKAHPAVPQGRMPRAAGELGPQQLLEAKVPKYLQQELGGENSNSGLKLGHSSVASARLSEIGGHEPDMLEISVMRVCGLCTSSSRSSNRDLSRRAKADC